MVVIWSLEQALAPPVGTPHVMACVEAHLLRFDRVTARVTEAWDWLSKGEQARAARFHTDGSRTRYVLAHAFLRGVLSAYLGLHPCVIDLRETTAGRPVLSDRQATPSGAIGFSLSHCDTHAAVAVAPARAIGVDVECRRAAIDWATVARRYFTDAEVEYLTSLPSTESERQFVRLWTCKEAFVKAIGLGLAYPLDRFEIERVDLPTPRAAKIESSYGPVTAWSFAVHPVDPHCYAAVAVRLPPASAG